MRSRDRHLPRQVRERDELRRSPGDDDQHQPLAAEGHRRRGADLMIGFVMFELALWTASFVYHYWPRAPKQPPPGAVGGVPRTEEGAPLRRSSTAAAASARRCWRGSATGV